VDKTNEHIAEHTKQKNTLLVEQSEHIGRAVRAKEHIVEQTEQKNTFVEREKQMNTLDSTNVLFCSACSSNVFILF
jgi:hypothetical protein